MEADRKSTKDKINAQVAYMYFVAVINLGFSFFEKSIFIDVVIISFLAFAIDRWNSRLSAAILFCFGVFAFYHQLPSFNDAGGWRIASIAWLAYASAVSLYLTIKINMEGTARESI